MELKVKLKRLHPDAAVPFKKYDDDYCYDCVATRCEELAPNVYKYWLGFALQVDAKDRSIKIPADKLVSINLLPRSSVWEHGMVLSNSEGVVDEGFTGEISAIFYHVLPNMPIYRVGERVCQMKIGFALPLEFVEVDELDQTERAGNGYGSTGR